MGTLKNNFDFTGRLGNLSAYTMRGHDGIILRTRGGASKSTIRTAPSFEPTRRLNREWMGVTLAAREIRSSLSALRPLADYNISGPLNALVKKIQVLDRAHPTGQRAIRLSQYPDFISGFPFNRKTLFDSLIRQPLAVSLDRSTGLAGFSVPALLPSVNFFPHPAFPFFQLVLALAAVSDYLPDEDTKKGYAPLSPLLPEYEAIYTGWAQTNAQLPAASFSLVPRNAHLPGPDMLLIAAAGIQYGAPDPGGSIQPAPYAGAAKILMAG